MCLAHFGFSDLRFLRRLRSVLRTVARRVLGRAKAGREGTALHGLALDLVGPWRRAASLP